MSSRSWVDSSPRQAAISAALRRKSSRSQWSKRADISRTAASPRRSMSASAASTVCRTRASCSRRSASSSPCFSQRAMTAAPCAAAASCESSTAARRRGRRLAQGGGRIPAQRLWNQTGSCPFHSCSRSFDPDPGMQLVDFGTISPSPGDGQAALWRGASWARVRRGQDNVPCPSADIACAHLGSSSGARAALRLPALRPPGVAPRQGHAAAMPCAAVAAA